MVSQHNKTTSEAVEVKLSDAIDQNFAALLRTARTNEPMPKAQAD